MIFKPGSFKFETIFTGSYVDDLYEDYVTAVPHALQEDTAVN